MADPVSMMAVISLGATAAGAVTNAFGQEYSAGAAANQQWYQAALANMNAKVAEQDAKYAEAAGRVRAQEIGMKGAAQVGTTRAAFGASNVAGPSQSRVLASETAVTQFEGISALSDAAKQAYGFRVRAASEGAQAGAFTAGAKTARVAGDIGAVSSILGGVAGVSSKWTQGQQSGMFASNEPVGVNPDSAYGRGVYSSSIYS